MLRFIRIIGYNVVPKQRHQLNYIYSRCNSTVVQENDIEVKPNFNNELYEKKKAFENAFANVNDVSSLLKTATAVHKIDYAFKALDMLAGWCDTKTIKFEEVERDENYNKLVSVVEKQAIGQHVSEIINALKNLKKIGVASNNFLVESLENDLLWNVRKVSVFSLLMILSFQLQYQETERQKKVLEQTIFSIERRWTEVKTSRDFCLIYCHSNAFSSNFLGHIDDLVIENSENMKLGELARVVGAISSSKRRPTPVLRSLAFHMFKKNDKLTPKQISNVLHAMNALNFVDEALLGKLSSDFVDQIGEVNQASIIRAVSLCVGQMRWKDKDLLNALGNWIIKNINICRSSDVASFILTLASVSHTLDYLDELVTTCLPLLQDDSTSEKNIWVDIVWSLAILGRATNEQIASVLEPTFVQHFPIDDPTCVGSYLKLLNINAVADVLLENYTGPRLQFSSFDNLLLTQSRKELSVHIYVQKILHNFLPPPKYLKENVRTTFGFTVDAELIVDKHSKPLNLSEYSSALEAGEENSKPLPEGAHRIALMVWNYKDFTLGSSSLTGQNALAVKILNHKGYKVVEIPYFDINKKEKTIKSVQYFERKIDESIKM